ncbi:MAG: hypothetical protein NVS1B6_11990 [Steroidobacteraceae bacterium]
MPGLRRGWQERYLHYDLRWSATWKPAGMQWYRDVWWRVHGRVSLFVYLFLDDCNLWCRMRWTL